MPPIDPAAVDAATAELRDAVKPPPTVDHVLAFTEESIARIRVACGDSFHTYASILAAEVRRLRDELNAIRAAIGRMPSGTLPLDVEKSVHYPSEYYATELHKAEELAASYRHALRVISFNLSQGMGDDDTTADELHQRIRDGINTIIRVERTRALSDLLESLRVIRSHLDCGGSTEQAVAVCDALLGKAGE